MKVLKFGGSSVGSAEGIRQIVDIVGERANDSRAVVVSALQGTTDQLIEAAELAARGDSGYLTVFQKLVGRHFDLAKMCVKNSDEKRVLEPVQSMLNDLKDVLHGVLLVREVSPKTLDFLMSFGERTSAFLISEILKGHGIDSEYLDARDVIVTDDQFGAAIVDRDESYKKIRERFNSCKQLQIVTGFIASTPEQETTTLGRGGSDYTAALIGAALEADEIEIWTDVDGVMTADPRVVGKTFPISLLSYEEVLELSHFGAQVIYPPTIRPVLDADIPIRIKNTFNPEANGSLITSTQLDQLFPVTGISSISDIALLQIEGPGLVGVAGTAGRLFTALARASVNIIMISQASSEHSICFAIAPEDLEHAKRAVSKEFAMEMQTGQIDPLQVEENMAVVALVGRNMRHQPGISGQMFRVLGKNGISVVAVAQGSSELNISAVVSSSDEAKALNALHDSFFLSEVKTVNIFLAGVGLVGSTLLEQVLAQVESLVDTKQLELRVVGLANSKQMLCDEAGINLDNWREALDANGSAATIEDFVVRMCELNLSNSIFVDCTASEQVAEKYHDILEYSISIVTPNKRANSSSWQNYEQLKETAKRANVKFLYETNVGAGLPLINTISDLIASGDEVLKIEAVLSGTLSYIFNSFRPGSKFSEIVREAREKGYTEPDPRDDLSGTDVARKLLILAREIGFPLEEKDVSVQSLIPASCAEAETAEDFLAALPAEDAAYEAELQKAADNGKVLRYIGSIHEGKAQVALEAVDASHPFYALAGSDNIISITTMRYQDTPLVVKGPGAGAKVTAAGVLADIVRVSSYLI